MSSFRAEIDIMSINKKYKHLAKLHPCEAGVSELVKNKTNKILSPLSLNSKV